MDRGDLDYCWKCETYLFGPKPAACPTCGQPGAYSIAHEQLVTERRLTFPGFHSHYLDADGAYIERFCPQTGRLILR